MIDLRPYQEQIIADARNALMKHNSVLIQSPTGSGKTALTVHMMGTATRRGLRSVFIVHQNELLQQTSRALWQQKLEHGMIASGKGRSPQRAQVASVLTLVNRLGQYEPFDLIIIDEAHRSAAATYRLVLDAYPDAKVIGLTATPSRTDGKGLGDIFNTIVQGPTVASLIEAGYLCDYEILAPPQLADVSGVKTTAGDYNKKDQEEAVNRPTITGDAVQHYIKHASGKRCVVMCVTLKHAADVCAAYLAAGVPAEALEGSMTDAERDARLRRFEAGTTLVLVNVQLLIEGVDIPAIECVQWLRATKSLIVWLQGIGRGLRPAKGKDSLLIFDHVGNWKVHGLPDEDREWTLESAKKGKRASSDEPDISVQQCRKCWHVFRPGLDACPSCGAPIEKMKTREMEIIDGELAKVEEATERKNKRQEQGRAKTGIELYELAKRKQVNNPLGWAVNVLAGREGRKPLPADYDAIKKQIFEAKALAQVSI